MKIKDGKMDDYNEGLANNTDPYGRRCFTYAEQWADLMEKRIADGETVQQCAQSCATEADTDGITGFMYGAAVAILSSCWERGEELRLWHNLATQIGTEGERANEAGTVLNPALLSIG